MIRIPSICVLIAGVLLAQEASAARLLAILPFDVRDTKGRMDASARGSLEDLLRDEAANSLTSSGWTVLTGENTYALLRDNGVDPATCDEGECHVATARELNVEVFVSGVVHYVDGQFVASVRLMETRTGRILASVRLEGTNTTALLRAFQKDGANFFTHAGLKTAAAPVESPPAADADSGAFVFVRASPSDSRLFIDGKEVRAGRQGPFAAGKHVVRAEATGYAPFEQPVQLVSGSMMRVSMELQPQTGRLMVSVNADSECEVGEKKMSASADHPADFELAAGSLRLVCRSEGREAVREIALAAGSNQEITINFVTLAPLPKAPEPVAEAALAETVPPQALQPPPPPAAPVRSGLVWGVVALTGGAIIGGGSAAFDNLAPTSHDHRLEGIDFLPVAGYAVALALGGVGVWQLVSK